MRGPPGDPQRASQLVAVFVEDAGELQQRRVADRVVADPDVPRVVVPVRQHEVLFAPVDARHRKGAVEPPLLQFRMQRDPVQPILDGLEQLVAVGAVDGRDRRGGLQVALGFPRRPPDGGADPPVDPAAGVDVDLTHGTGGLELRDRHGHGEALCDDDLSGDLLRQGVERGLEEGGQIGDLGGGDVERLRREPSLRGRGREGRRLGREAGAVHLDGGPARDGEIQFGLMDLVRDFHGVEARLDEVRRRALVRGPRLPDQDREPFQKTPTEVEGDIAQQGFGQARVGF